MSSATLQTQTPSAGLRHPSSKEQVPESDARDVVTVWYCFGANGRSGGRTHVCKCPSLSVRVCGGEDTLCTWTCTLCVRQCLRFSARSAGARICGHALAFQVVPACVDTCVRANVCVCVCVCNNAVSTCRIHCCSQHSMTSRHTARQSTKVCTLSVNQPNAHSASVNQPNAHTARQSAKCTRSTSISLIMHTQQVSLPNYVHTAHQSAKCTHSASICQIMHTQCVNLPNYAHTLRQSAKLCTHSASICQMHTQDVNLPNAHTVHQSAKLCTQCINLPLKCTHCTHIQTWEEPKQTSLKFKMLHSPALKWGQTLDNTVQCWDHSADGVGGGGGGEEKRGVEKIFLKRVKATSRNGYQPFHTGSGSVYTGSE